MGLEELSWLGYNLADQEIRVQFLVRVRHILENQNPSAEPSIGIRIPADILFLINRGNLNLKFKTYWMMC